MHQLLRVLDQLSYRLERRVFMVDGQELTACVSEECWEALADICQREGLKLDNLVANIARRVRKRSLSLELDLFALTYFQNRALPDGLHTMEPANLLPC
ncbi:hypothetical protein [Niveispirillum fermenti]|uniref:hypothetical protein n=1 Tax=Niveispirillum fermenti TaxID=1233113 RepID=UPI003A888C04